MRRGVQRAAARALVAVSPAAAVPAAVAVAQPGEAMGMPRGPLWTQLVSPPLLSSLRHASTVANAGNFDTEVLQSQSALCVVFHVNSRACKAHIAELEQLADYTNEASNYHWLKVVTVDADRNSNLASAFSVERRRVPMTFFVCNGTMIDKVSGRDLPSERLKTILTRFRDYFQKSRGVELEAHGPFMAARPETLTEGATTESMEAKLLDLLVGAARVDSATDDGRRVLADEAVPLIERARRQAGHELDELKLSVGVDVKKLDPAKLAKSLHGSSQFIAATHLCAIEMLMHARIAAGLHFKALEGDATPEEVAAAVARADASHNELRTDYKEAAAQGSVRRVVATAELVLCRLEASRVKAELASAAAAEKANASSPAASGSSPSATVPGPSPLIAVYDAARRVIIAADAIDVRNAPPGLPLDRVEPMLGDVRGLMTAARQLRAQEKQGECADVSVLDVQRALKLTKRTLFASLAAYGDDPVADKLRARASSLLY